MFLLIDRRLLIGVLLVLLKGLFQRAIMESGTSLCQFGRSRKAKQGAFLVGDALGLNTTSTQSLVDDLRKADYLELQNVSISIATNVLMMLIIYSQYLQFIYLY